MSYRWSFLASQWDPTVSELAKISSIIQAEEKSRIARFHFINDAKSSLIGRLLIRKLINVKTGTPNNLIQLARDEHNKPVLLTPNFKKGAPQVIIANASKSVESNFNKTEAGGDADSPSGGDEPSKSTGGADGVNLQNLNFNVSHQGSFVVLASDPECSLLGIDVMNIEKPGRITNNVDEYFRLMNRQFTENEWSQIRSTLGTSDKKQLTNFARFWSLKESYVKAIGVGIVIDLRTIDFSTKSELKEYSSGGGSNSVATDTQIQINGKLDPFWKFEERFLDSQHIVSVAKQYNKIADEDGVGVAGKESVIPDFERVNLDFLLENMASLGEEDLDWVDNFLKKK